MAAMKAGDVFGCAKAMCTRVLLPDEGEGGVFEGAKGIGV